MIREVIKPTANSYVLNLPDEMIGKTIEVIAFEIDSVKAVPDESSTDQNIDDIKKRYSRYPIISHDNYRFDRDDANNYE